MLQKSISIKLKTRKEVIEMSKKVDESTARLIVGLFVAQSTCAAKPATVGSPDMASAFASAFEHRKTVEYKDAYADYRYKDEFAELSKVDEIINKAIEEGIVEGTPHIRRRIASTTEKKP